MVSVLQNSHFETFLIKHPKLKHLSEHIFQTVEVLTTCYRNNGTLYISGNGGSYADALHISGEMMKSFESERKLKEDDKKKFSNPEIAEKLEEGLRTIVLGENEALVTAMANDIDPMLVYAQHLWALSKRDDNYSVLLGISTSGTSKLVANAAVAAKARSMQYISFTGENPRIVGLLADIQLKVPGDCTAEIQENMMIVYHLFCRLVEAEFFPIKK